MKYFDSFTPGLFRQRRRRPRRSSDCRWRSQHRCVALYLLEEQHFAVHQHSIQHRESDLDFLAGSSNARRLCGCSSMRPAVPRQVRALLDLDRTPPCCPRLHRLYRASPLPFRPSSEVAYLACSRRDAVLRSGGTVERAVCPAHLLGHRLNCLVGHPDPSSDLFTVSYRCHAQVPPHSGRHF